MKSINRRSFFTKAVGMFTSLLFIPLYDAPLKIIPELATFPFPLTVDAAGLEPHLEAFMWEILEGISVQASKASAEFSLGEPE